MVRFTKRGLADLNELPASLRLKAKSITETFDSQPGAGKKLKGALDGVRSIHLGRTHRILYRVDEKGPIVLTINWRKDVYK
jgi:mRNA-degrading endonuclease RelE of RelBE toxin-antitoxin system